MLKELYTLVKFLRSLEEIWFPIWMHCVAVMNYCHTVSFEIIHVVINYSQF